MVNNKNFEGCMNQQDALRCEKYLKTAWGKKYIKSRIKNYLALIKGGVKI